MLCAVLSILLYAHWVRMARTDTIRGCAVALLAVGALGQVWLWSSGLRPLPNAVATPHRGAATAEARGGAARAIAARVAAFLLSAPPASLL